MPIEHQLFLGLPLSDSYLKELKKLPPYIQNLFIQPHSSDYLQRVESKGIVYLGKCLGSFIKLADIETLQIHIYSLLKRLISDYPYEQVPLLLLPISLSPRSQT
jgi:hypothetical protein